MGKGHQSPFNGVSAQACLVGQETSVPSQDPGLFRADGSCLKFQ